MGDLLDALPRYVKPGGRVVSDTICLESTTELVERFRREPWMSWEIVQVGVARGIPVGKRLVRFDPLSPVWIIAAQL
ncbi:MAG: hypothetical protein ACYDCO_06340 [Armatimonadota bacterium]